MRSAIRGKLIQDITEIEGRVYEIQVPSKDTPKPFLIVKQGVDALTEAWVGYKRTVDVIIVSKRTSFKEVDKLAKKVIQSLDRQIIVDTDTNEAFTCLYDNSSIDYIDDDWNAITRTVSFSVLALRPYLLEEYIETSEVVEAIYNWTTENFRDIKVYKNIIPMDYITPSIIWRLEKVETTQLTNIHLKNNYTVRGHVLGRILGDEEKIGKDIVKTLKQTRKIKYLDKFFTIDSVDYSSMRDKFRDGQINLVIYSLDYITNVTDKIQKVSLRGYVNNE
jgi:arginine deiminase